MLMMLGSYVFTLNTAAYTNMNRETQYRWPMQELVGVPPGYQYVGPGEDNITLSGMLLPLFMGGFGQVDRMREEAEKGAPLMMVQGNGAVHGRWVIINISDKKSIFLKDGEARKIEFTMDLKRYSRPLIAPPNYLVGA